MVLSVGPSPPSTCNLNLVIIPKHVNYSSDSYREGGSHACREWMRVGSHEEIEGRRFGLSDVLAVLARVQRGDSHSKLG